ncbi:hypothetical protein SAMN02745195_01379 [Thermoanaerobacter uzonensis DSM 18761]|jgi:ribosomal protein L22|uniref:DUF2281 domain-containing protein n=1 Tax=Thermoanaerobacter uzonensis DSM 18761 TaxID=1123369 RepID=A0A1M4X940_9THEO|nr:hypothetical protein [Thermoanaerobacter uzonensis]SHE89987.1 hypothetical protein SAMN02745195_01379 [Thermoanaerobacter uzonensis DSM 18761]
MQNSSIIKKLNEIIDSLTEKEIAEVIDFAEYLKEKKKKELIKKFNDWDKSLEVEQMTHEEEKLLKESEGEYITLEEAKKALGIEDNGI